MASELNHEQNEAVEHESGSLLLSTGAGSGKTRVLVERYLKHVSDGVPVANLVAFTFTDKAAREMRQRIRDAIAVRQGTKWRQAELHLQTAAIDTIHGYCTSLLKRYASAAGLPGDFIVLEEARRDILRSETVREALESLLLETTPLADDLRESVVLWGWTRVLDTVAKFLDAPDPATWQDFLSKSPGQIASEWTTIANQQWPSLITLALESSPAIAALKTVEPATAEGKNTLNFVLDQLARLRNSPVAVDLTALLEKARVSNAHAGRRNYGTEQYDIVRHGFKAIRDVLSGDLIELKQPPVNLDAAADVAQRILRVVQHAANAFTDKKRQSSGLDFEDLLAMTRDLLRSNSAVREDVRQRTRFLLVDELQDTDALQMEIIELMLGERFLTGGLFAVGDAKQSIYRFRGAEVKLLESLRNRLPKESQRDLTINYRSRPSIIAFVNALCREWFPVEAPLKAERAPVIDPGVEFLWASPETERPTADDLRRAEAAAIASRIRELTTGASPRCQPSEIVLLFRSMTNTSYYESALHQLGINYYLVGGRAFFAQQEVFDIMNVLRAIENPLDGPALVGTLRSPIGCLSDDAITAICLDADDPWTGLHGDLKLVPSAERKTLLRIRQLLNDWRQVKDSLGIARLLQRIIADSAYDAALLHEPLGERKLANLWKLQEIARNFDRDRLGLAEFVSYLADIVVRQPREEQAATVPEVAADVVRIMSIHQAKGLEFPVVIIPDLSAARRPPDHPAARWHRELGALASIPGDCEEAEVGYPEWPWILGQKLDAVADHAEHLRLLYVACTRARELLILSGGVKGPDIEPTGPAMIALARVYNLSTGTPIGRGDAPPVRVHPTYNVGV